MYYHHLYLTIYLPVIDSEQRLCSITHLHSNSFKCFTTENGDHHVTQETTVFGQIAKMCSWQWRNFVLKGPPALTVIWPGFAHLKWGGGSRQKDAKFSEVHQLLRVVILAQLPLIDLATADLSQVAPKGITPLARVCLIGLTHNNCTTKLNAFFIYLVTQTTLNLRLV